MMTEKSGTTPARDLVAQAAHDLQEPLRVASGYLDLLCLHFEGGASLDAPMLAREARDATLRMQRTVASILASAERDHEHTGAESVRIDAALSDALANLHSLLEASRAQITHDALPILPGDPIEFARIFQNLIENSVKHGARLGIHVHVGASPSADGWTVTVDDDGAGWPPDVDRARLFLPYVRHDPHNVGGNGMGLASVRMLVERLGGEVSAEDAPQGGARVRMRFGGATA